MRQALGEVYRPATVRRGRRDYGDVIALVRLYLGMLALMGNGGKWWVMLAAAIATALAFLLGGK